MRIFVHSLAALLSLTLSGCGMDECEPNSASCTGKSSYRVCEYVMSGDHGGSYEWSNEICASAKPLCHEYESSPVCHPLGTRVCSSVPLLPAAYTAVAVSLGDANADSTSDVAMVLPYDSAPVLAVALGNGSGRLDEPRVVGELDWYNLGTYSPVLGDLTGDGVPDIAVVAAASKENSAVRWWGGLGGGNFALGGQAFDPGWAEQMILGDLDGDGRAELIVATAGDKPHVSVLGVQDGTLKPITTLKGASQPLPKPLAHLGDHRLAVGDTVYRFEAGALVVDQKLDTSGPIAEVVAHDLTQDGNVDLVLVHAESSPPYEPPVEIHVSDDSGVFSRAVTVAGGRGLAIADVDRNGYPDLVIPSLDARVRTYRYYGLSVLGPVEQTFPSAPPAIKILTTSKLGDTTFGDRVLLWTGRLYAMGDDCFPP